MQFADGAIWVGAQQGPLGPSGVYVIDGKTGARRGILPAAHGDVVGIAIDGTRVYSTSAEGELALTTTAGAVVFRTRAPAPIVTPPTLADTDGDGKLEVAVGDGRGNVSVFDGATGKIRWARAVGGQIGLGLAAADLDGDGRSDIVAGTDDGGLFALSGENGATLWHVTRKSPFRAAPVLCDVDANGKLEVIAGTYDGDLAIFAGATGRELWTQHVEEDNGGTTGIVASPTPLPGGTLLVPTARHGAADAILLVKAHDRAYRAREGSVFASPVLGTVRVSGAGIEGIVGTESGDVYSFDAAGRASFLYRLGGAIAAPGLVADIGGNGIEELVIATREGKLTALAIHAALPPLVGVARGNARHNDGVLPAIDLGWRL
jgi:outer membrane protein assembly factor BamB